jgi:hypothetical protein
MLREDQQNRYSCNTLLNNLRKVLISIENDIELFESLLLSYSDRLKAVIEAEGSHTDY